MRNLSPPDRRHNGLDQAERTEDDTPRHEALALPYQRDRIGPPGWLIAHTPKKSPLTLYPGIQTFGPVRPGLTDQEWNETKRVERGRS